MKNENKKNRTKHENDRPGTFFFPPTSTLLLFKNLLSTSFESKK